MAIHEKTILIQRFIDFYQDKYTDDPLLGPIFAAMLPEDVVISEEDFQADKATATLTSGRVKAPLQSYIKADVETSPLAWTITGDPITDVALIPTLEEPGIYEIVTDGVTTLAVIVMGDAEDDTDLLATTVVATAMKWDLGGVAPTIAGERIGWAPESALYSMHGSLDIHVVANTLILPETDLGLLVIPETV